MKLVRENIKFKRGMEPKEALEIGRKNKSLTNSGFKAIWDEDLPQYGMRIQQILGDENDVPEGLFFEMNWKDFRKHFDEGKMSIRFEEPQRNLTSFLAGWIHMNTVFFLDEINTYKPSTGKPIGGWHVSLKR